MAEQYALDRGPNSGSATLRCMSLTMQSPNATVVTTWHSGKCAQCAIAAVGTSSKLSTRADERGAARVRRQVRRLSKLGASRRRS